MLTRLSIVPAGIAQLTELDLWQSKQCTLLRAARLEKMRNTIDEVSEEEEAEQLLALLTEGKTYAILDVLDKVQHFKMSGIFSHVVDKDIQKQALVSKNGSVMQMCRD